MFAILKTRIEYDPYEPKADRTDYHDILPAVFDNMKDAIEYIDAQIAEDEVTCPEYTLPLDAKLKQFTYVADKHQIRQRNGEASYLAIHKTYAVGSHALYRWLEYEVFPVFKKRHSIINKS